MDNKISDRQRDYILDHLWKRPLRWLFGRHADNDYDKLVEWVSGLSAKDAFDLSTPLHNFVNRYNGRFYYTATEAVYEKDISDIINQLLILGIETWFDPSHEKPESIRLNVDDSHRQKAWAYINSQS